MANIINGISIFFQFRIHLKETSRVSVFFLLVSIENGNLRAHYTKTTVRAGEVLRLAAVFQDTRRSPVSTGIAGVTSGAQDGKNSRASERDQYAQCLDSQGHELFAPLSSRGEFYATCQSGSLDTGSDAVLYRVHQLARRDLPLRVWIQKCKSRFFAHTHTHEFSHFS